MLAFVLSAVSGVGRGIQYISNANMVLAAILAIFVFVMGPTVVLLNMVPTAVGNYFQNFFEMAARTADSADGTAGPWLSSWTIVAYASATSLSPALMRPAPAVATCWTSPWTTPASPFARAQICSCGCR